MEYMIPVLLSSEILSLQRYAYIHTIHAQIIAEKRPLLTFLGKSDRV